MVQSQPDGVDHPDAKFRSIVDQLLDLYESPQPIEVDATLRRVAPLTHGWYIAVRRLGLATIHLIDAGFEHEAAPLRRSLIEHVIALRWLARATDDAVTSILRSYQRSLVKLQEAVTAAGWPVAEDGAFDEILGVDPGSSSEDRNLHFRQLCEEYGTGDLYSAWLVETTKSHPSFSTATAYLQPGGELGQTRLAHRPVGYPGHTVSLVAWALLIASESFNELIADRPWTGTLAEIGAELAELVGTNQFGPLRNQQKSSDSRQSSGLGFSQWL